MESPKAQRNLLHAFERLVDETPALLARVPHVLKALYELDIVGEEALLAWPESPGKLASPDILASMRVKAAPFLHWLWYGALLPTNARVHFLTRGVRFCREPDSDDDSNDDDDVEFGSSPTAGSSVGTAAGADMSDDEFRGI